MLRIDTMLLGYLGISNLIISYNISSYSPSRFKRFKERNGSYILLRDQPMTAPVSSEAV